MPIQLEMLMPEARAVLKLIEKSPHRHGSLGSLYRLLGSMIDRATPTAPWRSVVGIKNHYNSVSETLACGHIISHTGQIYDETKWRRCKECAPHAGAADGSPS